MKINNYFGLTCLSLALVAGVLGCGSGMDDAPKVAPSASNVVTASSVLGAVSDAQWTAAEGSDKIITMTMEKVVTSLGTDNALDGTTGTAAADTTAFSFSWTVGGVASSTAPTLVAGTPYVIKFINKYQNGTTGANASFCVDGTVPGTCATEAIKYTGNNSGEHYFSNPDFYKSIIVKKVVTATATYYTPYLNDFELNAPTNNSNTSTEGKIYFVPVKSGTFPMTCKEGTWNSGGHATIATKSGMYTELTITGGSADVVIDFELPTDLSSDFGATLGYLPLTTDSASTSAANAIKLLKKINYAINPASATGTCNYGAYAPFWWNMTLTESAGSVSVAATKGDLTTISTMSLTAHDGSSSAVQSGTCTDTNYPTGTKYGYVWRFTKAAGTTGAYTIQSNNGFFKTIALRKIHDLNAQIKPYLLTKIDLESGESSNNASLAKPGPKQIDLYFMPTVVNTFNLNFTSGSTTTDSGNISVIAQ